MIIILTSMLVSGLALNMKDKQLYADLIYAIIQLMLLRNILSLWCH